MTFQKYSFKIYNSNFPSLFKREKLKLKKLLPHAEVEHIGSSAVPGLGGKGILDVLVGVRKIDMNRAKKTLIAANYLFKPHAGSEDRLFFEKDYVYSEKTRRVHLQLTWKESKIWKDALRIRDVLRNNKTYRDKYALLKKKAVSIAQGEGKKYRAYKHAFLDSLRKVK